MWGGGRYMLDIHNWNIPFLIDLQAWFSYSSVSLEKVSTSFLILKPTLSRGGLHWELEYVFVQYSPFISLVACSSINNILYLQT